MSSSNDFSPSAEQQFRDAFERLKARKPLRLSASSPVTQNNVAKEAGKDPSALRKSRYPLLIADIQRHVMERTTDIPLTPHQKIQAQRRKNRSMKEQLEAVKAERDLVMSQLLDAQAKILELAARVTDLEHKQPPSNVRPMHSRQPQSYP